MYFCYIKVKMLKDTYWSHIIFNRKAKTNDYGCKWLKQTKITIFSMHAIMNIEMMLYASQYNAFLKNNINNYRKCKELTIFVKQIVIKCLIWIHFGCWLPEGDTTCWALLVASAILAWSRVIIWPTYVGSCDVLGTLFSAWSILILKQWERIQRKYFP